MWNFFTGNKIVAKGKNVNIRTVGLFDYKYFSKWFNNTEIMGNAFGIIAEDEYILKLSKDYFKELVETPHNAFTIVSKSDKQIGIIRFSIRGGEKKYAILGILLGDKRFLGRGYGTEAMFLILEYFFTKRELNYIELDTAVFNERAQRTFRACGFKDVGEFQEIDYNTGNVLYKILMRIEKEQFFDLLKNCKGKYFED